MKNRIGYKLFLLLAMAILLTASAAVYSLLRLQELSKTVDRLSQPDSLRAQTDSMLYQIDIAENNMRFFALNNNDEYLSVFNNLSVQLENDTAMLRRSSAQLPSGNEKVSELSALLKEKMDLHTSLIGIRYNNVLRTAFTKLDSSANKTQPQKDSVVVEEQQKFFARLFGSSKSKRKEKQLTDSVAYQKQIIALLQQQMLNVGESGRKQLDALKDKELVLLKRNEILTSKIRNTLSGLQSEAATLAAQQATLAKQQAKITEQRLQILTLSGSLLVLILVLAIYRDLAKAARVRMELEIARKKAEQLAEGRELFLADISHELRTPLSAISGLSDLFKQTHDEQQRIKYADAIQHSSTHLLSLINDLLDNAHIETGKFKLESKAFNPKNVIDETIEILQAKAAEKNLKLVSETNELNNLVLEGDATRLKQILFNLTGNAIKYTVEGSVSVHTKILERENQKIILQIIIVDTGAGMDDEMLGRLFGRFEKGKEETTDRNNSGLGLNITQRLVELQNGKINIESKPGKGTTVEIILPYKISSSVLKEEKSSEETKLILTGYKILLAEDDEWNREIALKMLTTAGAEVKTVINGSEAFSVLEKENFSLAIFDLQMPEMDGITSVKKLRASENTNKLIPVYALTADRIRHNKKEELIAEGFTGSLLKPLQWNDLAEILNGKVMTKLNTEKSSTIFDLNDLKKMTGNDPHALNHFINLFLHTAAQHLNDLQNNVKKGNWNAAADIAHKLVPSSRQFHADELANHLEEIEQWKGNFPDEKKADQKMEIINTIAQELFSGLMKVNHQ